MELSKNLNKLDVFSISTGAMLSGVFLLPGLAYEQAGPAILISYLFAALLALTGLLSQAELVSAMPKAGGTYFYITRSMGSAVGTVYGLITWFSLSLKSAYELFFMAALLGVYIQWFSPVQQLILAVSLCTVFMLVNLIGVKEAGKIQVYLVFTILAALAYFCISAFPSIEEKQFLPFAPGGFDSIFKTAGFVFISFGGLLKVASVAEEVKNPGKVIPQCMILSILVVSLVYLVVVFVIIGVLDSSVLRGSKSPLTDAAFHSLGDNGKMIFGFMTLLAIFTSANAGVMTASRYPLALARDEMLPSVFGNINKRFKTPHAAIIVTGLIIIVAFFVPIDKLVKAASSVLILTYIFSCLAVIILRESHVQNYQPQFRSILYPWVQVFGSMGFLLLLYEIGLEALAMTCLLMLMGFVLYWFYGRKKDSKEYALLHLIERVTSRGLTGQSVHSLENELKEIIHERDEILKDRFDHLVEECAVLDFHEDIPIDDFFKKAAEAMSNHLEIDANTLKQRFLEREKEGSTVINPFLAIPHVVVEGEKHFDVLLARNKEGFIFSEDADKVHTVFMLVGTKDERSFHLTALAAIAQIVQDPDFETRWMKAKSDDALRDIVLLSKRKRN